MLGKEIIELNTGKKYLFGKKGESYFYLEAPRFECGWYWGFGYLEEYSGKPIYSEKNWKSHTHLDTLTFINNVFKTKYVEFEDTPFTDDEKWKLWELFKRFYAFKRVGEGFYTGRLGITTIKDFDLKDEEMYKKFLEYQKKAIDKIIEIVSPNEK